MGFGSIIVCVGMLILTLLIVFVLPWRNLDGSWEESLLTKYLRKW